MADTSILTDVKKTLGLDEDYTAFDLDIVMHINTAFAILSQLGPGPSEGYMIEDNTATWSAFYSDPKMNAVRTYVYLKVRSLFDPPQTGYLVDAMKQQLAEMEWRLNTVWEETGWTPPVAV